MAVGRGIWWSGLGAHISFLCLILILTDLLYQDWPSQQQQQSGAALHCVQVRLVWISMQNVTRFFSVPKYSIFEWWHGVEGRGPCDESSHCEVL